MISKYFEGELTPEEKVFLFNRISTDKEWKKEFATMQNLYGLTSWLPSDNDEAEGIGKLLDFKQKYTKRSHHTPWKHLFGYAAAVLVSIGCTITTLYIYGHSQGIRLEELVARKDMPVTYEEFTAPSGQRALVKLHDGSTVWLNAHTTLRYPNHFSAKERRVTLDGEAFFEVKKNEGQPFIVETEKIDIKVTGTSFNVFAYHGQDEFSTSLVEGTVSVYTKENKSKALILKPKERASLSGNQLLKQPFTQMDFLLWKDGIYAFDDIPFEKIAKKLELYYDIAILIDNKKLKDFKFSGKFRQRDGVENVLHTLCKIQNFSYVKDDTQNTITIR